MPPGRDLLAAVCDTHALVFHAARDPRLGNAAAAFLAACEEGRALAYIPMAVLWELSLLVRKGRLELDGPFSEFTDRLFHGSGFHPLALEVEQVVAAHRYRPNPDPFDALIVAAARSLRMPLVTRDREITASGLVETIW